jgi:putative ABC transport system permease protein
LLGAVSDPGFFATLQVSPRLGRLFTEEEMEPGRDAVIVLGYNVWQQRFGGDERVIGQQLMINGRQRTVIGVMPPGFEYPAQAVMWGPLPLDAQARARRDLHSLRVIARLKDGTSLEQARAEFQTIGTSLAREYPDVNKDAAVAINPVIDDLVGDVRSALLVVSGAVGFVLLIACANIANLLLAKASTRRHEMALRASLGASRSSILAQVVIEGSVLAILGGAAGLALTSIGFDGLLQLVPANVPRLADISLNWRVIGVSLGLSIATGVLFGLAPACYAARIDVNSMLKEGFRGAGSRNRVRGALLAGQIAAALILLSGAGLLLRSFYQIVHVDIGFEPEHVMTMQVQPAPIKYLNHDGLQFQLTRGILASVATIPGVRSAGVATALPLLGNPIYIMRFEGGPPVAPSQAPVANFFTVTPGFFDAMGINVIRGRGIYESDTASSPLVAVVNQTLADRYFPGEDPIGKRLEIAFSTPARWREIVGVIDDVKTAGVDQDTPVQVYAPYYQKPGFIGLPPLILVARTIGDPAAVTAAMKSSILRVDPSQPVFAEQPLAAIVKQSIAQRRVALILLAFFAASALLLASIGVYGIMSYNVTQRKAEVGIRIAMGARASQVALLVGYQGLRLVLAGLITGSAGSLLLAHWMGPLLFHVNPRDPLVLIVASTTLLLVSCAACFLPVRRAALLDPLVALRSE